MSLIQVLGFAFVSVQQSLAQDSSSVDFRSNTCLRRTAAVYTSASQTYVITDLGSTSFAASPSFCSNITVSTSTVYSAGTITVTEQATVPQQSAAPSASGATGIADNGFEEGSANPFNTSASAPDVAAQVAQGGQGSPFQPFAGNSYL